MSTRTEPSTPVRGPVRTCVGCRAKAPRATLVRIVLDPTNAAGAVVDHGRCAPGRGAWLHPSQECLDLAGRRRAVPRALRVAGPVDLTAVAAWFDHEHDRAASDALPGDDEVIDKKAGWKPMGTR